MNRTIPPAPIRLARACSGMPTAQPAFRGGGNSGERDSGPLKACLSKRSRWGLSWATDVPESAGSRTACRSAAMSIEDHPLMDRWRPAQSVYGTHR